MVALPTAAYPNKILIVFLGNEHVKSQASLIYCTDRKSISDLFMSIHSTPMEVYQTSPFEV